MHLRVKTCKCEWPQCGQSFVRIEHLDKHISEAHTGKMPYPCDWPGCEYQVKPEVNKSIHIMNCLFVLFSRVIQIDYKYIKEDIREKSLTLVNGLNVTGGQLSIK
jgi:hypothetical protein